MFSNKKNGGIRFIRIHRLSVSFCITKRTEVTDANATAAVLIGSAVFMVSGLAAALLVSFPFA